MPLSCIMIECKQIFEEVNHWFLDHCETGLEQLARCLCGELFTMVEVYVLTTRPHHFNTKLTEQLTLIFFPFKAALK